MIEVVRDNSDAALDELRLFEERNSRNGLFLRYCRGRVKNVVGRQSATAAGSLALGLFYEPAFGFLVLVIALAGEAVDCLALHGIWQRFTIATVTPMARHLATATATFQAMTIAACVIVGWACTPYADGRIFAASFLIGTAINAGVVRQFFCPAADMRLGVYALTLAGLVINDVARHDGLHDMSPWQGLFLVAVTMMVFVTATFIAHVSRTLSVRWRIEHDLLVQKHSLALSRAEAQRRERRARMLALVAENANDSVVITDPAGRIEWVNDTFVKLTGYAANEVIGRAPGDVLNSEATDDAVSNSLDRARAERVPYRTEILNRTKSGERIWMEASLTPVFNADGSFAMTIAVERDITEAKDREEELGRARHAAETAARAKSQFLASMSHEIRTPMNGVIATAELLSETDLTADQTLFVSTIVDSGRALLTIINDVLDLSKPQSEGPVIHAAPFDLCECLSGVENLLRPQAQSAGLSLTLTCPDSVPKVVGDSGRIRQIMVNLIGNAVKFTNEGGVDVEVEHAPGAEGGVSLSISVTDAGIGIPPDRIAKVFDSFTQADGDISRRYGGSGLGLTISRLLAQQMGGDISATSEVGKGSRFVLSLELPLAGKDHPVGQVAREVACTKDPCGADASCVILVAEDNRTNAFIAERMLAGPGRVLHFAADGAQAVALFRQLRPEIVFMDVSMPVLDGIEATRAIRQIEADETVPRRCPIIALTANAFEEDRKACQMAGCDDFLAKPVAKADLLAMLTKYVIAEDLTDETGDLGHARPDGAQNGL